MSKEQIEKLEAEIAAKAERLNRLKSRAASKERKATNKRRYLIGAMVEAWMREDASIDTTVMDRLAGFLTRDSDRRYFGFASATTAEARPISESGSSDTEESQKVASSA